MTTPLSDKSQSNGLPLYAQWLIVIASGLMTMISMDPWPFFLGMAVFFFFLKRFYTRHQPPVLLFCFLFQWLFFQTQLFDALTKGVDLTHIDFLSRTKPDITVLGLIAVTSFFAGIYVVIRKIPPVSKVAFIDFFSRVSIERIAYLYLFVYLLVFFEGGLIWLFPPLSQPLVVLFEFRWGLFFLLFCTAFVQNRYQWMVICIIFFESIASLFSFFAHFKEVFIFAFISCWIFIFRFNWFYRLMIIPAVMLVIFLGVIWSSVKEDYRDFLNRGSGSQVVLVSRTEAYNRLIKLVSTVDDKKMEAGFEELVDRLSWIGAFDAVYNYVPKVRPHEEGKLWMEGINRTVTPRLFFPEKKALTDSKELNYYSGIGADEKNTSISLSMIAASYIDFGVWGMHIPIFLFGAFCGWVYRKAFQWAVYPPVGFALVMPFVYLLDISELSINKLIPHIFLYFMILWIIHKLLLRTLLNFILIKSRAN